MGVFRGTHRGLGVAGCPSEQILLCQSILQGGVECKIGVWIVGLQGEMPLLAMAFVVQLVDLENAEQEVSRAGEVFGGEGD